MEPSHAPRQFTIAVRHGEDEVLRVPLGPEPIVIGRGGTSLVRLADSRISREHARVTVAHDGTVLVADLGSRNGTIVGGRRLGPIDGPAPLGVGETADIGGTLITLESEADADDGNATTCMARDAMPAPAAAPGADLAAELGALRRELERTTLERDDLAARNAALEKRCADLTAEGRRLAVAVARAEYGRR